MTERGILFSGAMVRALLDGTKTQTRRAIKKQPWASCSIEEGSKGETPFVYSALHGAGPGHEVEESRTPCRCPYGQPGDRLWVRETCAGEELSSGLDGVRYGADDAFIPIKGDPSAAIDWLKLHTYGLKPGQRPVSLAGRKVPSIHMPRWASRILLEIVSVRVERLQDISAEDYIAEGLSTNLREHDAVCDLRDQYRALWESINGAGSWDANPWVWVVEFKRVLS